MSEQSFFADIDQEEGRVERERQKTPLSGDDRFFEDVEQISDVGAQAQTNLNVTRDINPEQEAKNYQMSKDSGYNLSIVREAPEKVESQLNQPKFTINDPSNIQNYISRSISNAAMSGDDIPQLEEVQLLVNKNKGTIDRLLSEQLTFSGIARTATAAIATGAVEVVKSIGDMFDFFAPFIVDKRKLEFADKNLEKITLTRDLQDWLRNKYGKTKAEELVGSAFESLGMMGSLLATGGGSAILPGMATVSGIGKTTEALEGGAKRSNAVVAGIMQAGTEYLTEKIPLDILRAPARSFLAKLAKGAAFDVPGELIATATEMWLIDQKTLGGEAKSLDEYKQALIDTMFVSIIATTATTAPVHGVQRIQDRAKESGVVVQIAGANKDKKFHQNLTDEHATISKTKTAHRSRDHIKELTETVGRNESVGISPEGIENLYFQKNKIEADELLKKIGVNPPKALKAVADGNDVVVKVSEILTLESEDFNLLKNDIKETPSSYSAREIQQKQYKDDIQNSINLLKEEDQRDEAVNQELERIKQEGVKAKLDKETVENAPILLKGLADRLQLEGVDPVEFLKKVGLKRGLLEDVKAFFQPGKRGAVPVSNESHLINLFEDADMSTVLHEVGHIALKEYVNLETTLQASDSLKADLATIREWVGSQEGAELTREQSEQFALGFEAYLMEGKAPTVELRTAFERFKRWLVNTYRTVKKLDVKLNKDVRKVFDRMLSASIEVEAAAQTGGFQVKTVDEMKQLGMSTESQTVAKLQIDKMTAKAEERLTRARNKGYRENVKQWRKDSETELRSENPNYDTMDLIVKEENFIDRDEFIDRYTKEGIAFLPNKKILKKDGLSIDSVAILYEFEDGFEMADSLFRTQNLNDATVQRTAQKQAAHDAQWTAEDFLADLKEYRDYQEIMSRHIAGKGVNQAEIDAGIQRNVKRWETEAAQTISQEQPDLTGEEREGAIADIVQERIEEFQRKKARPGVISQDSMKALAKEAINAKSVREARRVDKFMGAIKKAASAERRAIMRSDWAEASKQNEIQRFNYEMASLSSKISAEVDTILNRSKRIGKPKKNEKVDPTHKEAILHLISRFNLASLVPREPGITPNYNALFAGDDYGNDGFPTPDFFFNNSVKDFRDLSMEQMRELDNAIRYLEGQGHVDKKTFLSDGETRLQDVGQRSMAEMDAQDRQRVFDQFNPWRKINDPARKKLAEITNISFITAAYGGYTSLTGQTSFLEKHVTERLKDMTDAQTRRMRIELEGIKPFSDHIIDAQRKIIKKYKGRKLFVLDNGVPVPALLQKNGAQLDYWTPEQIFSMAFNRGNEGNTNALLDGYEGLTLEQVDSLLERYLTVKDVGAIQGIIDAMERLFPEADNVHVNMKNYHMTKVEARPWVFKGKAFKGGYFPLKIDRNLASMNTDIFNNVKEAEEFFEKSESKYVPPFVASGFSKTRKGGHALPVDIRLFHVNKHFDEVVRYITMAEGTSDISRIVTYSERQTDGTRKSFKKSATRILGEDMYNQVLPAIEHTINPRLSGVDQPGGKFIGFLRGVAVSRNIAAKLFTGLKQPFSLFGGIHDLGVKTGGGLLTGFQLMAKGSAHVMGSPSSAFTGMLDKSDFMRARITNWERDLLRPTFNKMTPSQRELVFGDRAFTWDDVIKATFITVSAPDIATVTPIWWGAYLGKINDLGTNEKEAVRHADNIIRHSQPTAAPIDRSQWFRKNGFWGLFNLHQTFTVGTYGQRQRTWYRAWKNGEVSTTEYARFNTMDAIIPMVFMQIMVTWLKSGDLEDPETQKDILITAALKMVTTGIPMADTLLNAVLEGSRGGLLDIPGARQFDRWFQTAHLISGGIGGMTRKEKARAYWGIFDMASDIARVPASRIVRQAIKGKTIKQKLFGPPLRKKR
jgi:hypothetical protein